MNDAHNDLTVTCGTELDERTEDGYKKRCGETLTYVDHYVGLCNRREWEGKALHLKCDECGGSTLVCPICHGGGYYRGDQTKERLACHVCNTRDHIRQRRQEKHGF